MSTTVSAAPRPAPEPTGPSRRIGLPPAAFDQASGLIRRRTLDGGGAIRVRTCEAAS
ncbi:hypothetical protein [Conexibacter arvalis]|uniref:Uncharacterized protein n=1 Tax=Conexibacter arvalis TaxID=912552 RepID=A0A840ID85_9ACTN|nr:hypothetical protein [Conexibacter arvalis]MBB4662211.1 hypothetical protein [Conexibacter arvalis]